MPSCARNRVGTYGYTMNRIAIPEEVYRWMETLQAEAYQKGWEAATAAMVEAASAKRGAPSQADANGSTQPLANRTRVRLSDFGNAIAPTYRDRIIEALKAKPGMRSAEVGRWIKERHADANPNSIQTTIKRMKKKEIRQRGVRLYLADLHEQEAA